MLRNRPSGVKPVSMFLDEQRIYYNFLRPHTALDGRTPAETAQIGLKLGDSKLLELVKKAAVSRFPVKPNR